MTPEPGPNFIRYHELAQTPGGLGLWNEYMRQVAEIGLQYPHHFFSRTAKKIIPEDAQRHQFYAYLGDGKTIVSFCIATVSCDQAELLWAASHKDRRGKMPELYRFIEQRLFTEENVSKIIGMCCSEDSRISNEDGELIDGRLWANAHRFHEKMGYRFTYKLEDYWGEGSHAFVFSKFREPRRYGYTNCEGFVFRPGSKKTLKDTQPELNQKLQRTIVPYLDVFDETFARNFAPEEQKSFVQDDCLKGFTGLALLNSISNKATLFAKTSSEPEPGADRAQVLKYEYDTDASALTQMLATDSIQNDIGILYYPADWDKDSEISILSYCARFYPSLLGDIQQHNRGFTVFYARRTGIDNHKSVLYFVTPEIENVVWYKPLWRAFADYSFALILEIYSYFSSMLVLDSGLRDNDYFNNLIKAVSPVETPGSDDDFLNKIARMKQTIQERYDAHHEAALRSKEKAIAHYGHTMGHRISPVVAYFESHDTTTEAASCARLLQDMALVLQAHAVRNAEDFFNLNSNKGGRFVEYKKSLDLLSLLQNEIRAISAKEVQMPHCIVFRYPEFEIHAAKAIVDLDLIDSKTSNHCRLQTAFFTQLLSELVINAVQHGWHSPSDQNETGKKARVRIRVDTITLHGKPALILTNYYSEDAKPAPSFFRARWGPWPEDRENDGPGMAVSVFRAVQAGKMMLKVTRPIPEQNEPGQVHVALFFEGLHIN